MRAIDTNLLVRLATGDDAVQTAIAEQFVAEGAWVSILALAEALWVLATKYRRTAAELAGVLEMLVGHATLVLQDADAVAAALVLFRRRPTVGFSDCLMLELARKYGHLPLGTFDRGLGKIAGAQRLG